ncbi:MAG: phosphate regulon sensor histidine kinase PhoR [Steroidobacteraceae bacterium]
MPESRATLQAWGFVIGRLLLAAAVGLSVGLFVDDVQTALLTTLALYLTLHLYHLYRLDYWLRHRSTADPPDAGGIWGDVVARVVRLHRRKKFHKQRLIEIFRELRRSTASMPDGVITLNRDDEIVWFNRTAGRLLGLRRKVDFGLRIENLIRHPDFSRYLVGGQYSEPAVIRPDGAESRWLSFQIVPFGDAQKLMFVRDVTRQNQLDEMRKDFIANASHELRSPLTVISGYLETLAGDPKLDTQLRSPVAEMRRQAQRMTAIIEDLLELSRLETEEGEVSGEPLDVAALIALLRKDLLARQERPHEVRVSLESQDGLVGDEGQIHSAFANLVDNAAKYTPPDGTITMRWWVDEDGGHFSVTDTGIGITAEHLPRLTERFYRVDPGRSRATGGSGLGLAIVKHVLQRHGGRLHIASVEGQGSTFSCHFPRRRIVAGTVPHSALRVSA